jgi:hypothetical protein
VRVGQTLHSRGRFYLSRPADVRRLLSGLAVLAAAPTPAAEKA